MNINVKPSDRTDTSANNQHVRKRGRPALNGPEKHTDRREDIVQASSCLFFQNGYTGTTLRRVAKTANVNVALIHYYFGSKQGLYQEVLCSAFAETFASLRGYQRSMPVLHQLVHLMTAPLLGQPALARAFLFPNGPAEALAEIANIKRRLRLHLSATLQSMQRTNHLCSTLNADLFTSTFLDLCWGPIRRHIEDDTEGNQNDLSLAQHQIAQNTRLLEMTTRPQQV
ncbi:MAG: TetR/AcrR family transcriptional regulator [Rhodobiaceae bacterium]|nr:TetR/AcrR family transcriptional regulator [Rhodobiaceae bacterium]